MLFSYVLLLTVDLMTFTCSSPESSCDEDCADKPVFTPPSLVVEFGHEASISCTACQHGCREDQAGMEISAGEATQNGTAILWRVDSVTQWNLSAVCYYTQDDGKRCCSRLPVTVYKPPTRVSLQFEQRPFYSGYEYTLQCRVEDVAPIGNVMLIFYSAHLPTFHHQFSNWSVVPVTESYTVTGRTMEDSDGAHHWCEAKLHLGPDHVLKYPSKFRRDIFVPFMTNVWSMNP